MRAEWHVDSNANYRTLAEIQRNVFAQGERNVASRLFHSRNDKDAIAAWRQDLNRILQIFSVRSASLA